METPAADVAGATDGTNVPTPNPTKKPFEPMAVVPFPYSLIRNSLACNIGYKMEIQNRQIGSNMPLYNSDHLEDWALGVTVVSIPYVPTGLVDMVRPMVKIHAVNIETGKYIKSLKHSTAIPLSTKYVIMKNSHDSPHWRDELIIDATYRDVVHENTLLLFELFDDKPSVSMNKLSIKKPPKRIAWGYLLPIGGNRDRRVTVGIFDEWLLTKRHIQGKINTTAQSSRKPRIDKKRSQSNADDRGSGKENELDALLEQEQEQEENEGRAKSTSGHECDVSLRIQLYEYIRSESLIGDIQCKIMGWPHSSTNDEEALMKGIDESYPDGIPLVYLQWRRQRHIPIKEATLRISAGPRRIGLAMGYHGVNGVSVGFNLNEQNAGGGQTVGGGDDKDDMGRMERKGLRSAILKRIRGSKEPCVVPDKVLHRLNVGPEGAMVVKYSHCGHLLAVTAKSSIPQINILNQSANSIDAGSAYSLRLYDSDTGVEVWNSLAAHNGVIYDIVWTHDDTYLLTASGDGTLKIWDVQSLYVSHQQRTHSKKSSAASDMMSIATGATQSRAGGGGGGGDASIEESIPPYCLHTMISSPPVYNYSALFQEHSPKSIASALIAANNAGAGSPGGDHNNLSNSRDDSLHGSFSVDHSARAPPPRVISGSSDGTLRVWEGGTFLGYINLGPGTRAKVDVAHDTDNIEEPAHESRVQVLAIDERTRFLISGDASGEVMIWRCDRDGWYQFLRRFKRDHSINATLMQMTGLSSTNRGRSTLKATAASAGTTNDNQISQLTTSGVFSLTMHPDKNRPQILVMSHDPSQLRIYNMSSYRVHSICSSFKPNVDGIGVFSRATLSADGRFAICGVATRDNSASRSNGPSVGNTGSANPGDRSNVKSSSVSYGLNVWDSQSGNMIKCPLSEFSFPYPIRSISWHPKQHVMAVAMIGEGAAVIVYSGVKEDSSRAATQANAAMIASIAQHKAEI